MLLAGPFAQSVGVILVIGLDAHPRKLSETMCAHAFLVETSLREDLSEINLGSWYLLHHMRVRL